MTILGNIPHYPPAATRNRRWTGRFLIARVTRMIDHLVAAMIARQQRQAELFVLRHLSDRELKDIGITRGDIGPGLEDAAKTRARLQGFNKA